MKPSKPERDHLGLVAEFPCLICACMGILRQAEVHHIKSWKYGRAMGSKSPGCHYRTIPLCREHHGQDLNAKPGIGFHAGERVWNYDQELILNWLWSRLQEQGAIPRSAPVGEAYEPPIKKSMSSYGLLLSGLRPKLFLRLGGATNLDPELPEPCDLASDEPC